MKNFIKILIIILFLVPVSEVSALTKEGNTLESTYRINGSKEMRITEKIILKDELKSNNIIREIPIEKGEKINVYEIKVTKKGEGQNIYTLYKNEPSMDNYSLVKEENNYKVLMDIEEFKEVEIIEISYDKTFEEMIKDEEYVYVKMKLYGNKNNTIKLTTQSHIIENNTLLYYTRNSNYNLNNKDYKGVVVYEEVKEDGEEVILGFSSEYYLFKELPKKGTTSIKDEINDGYMKVIEDKKEGKSNKLKVFGFIVFSIILAMIIIRKNTKKKNLHKSNKEIVKTKGEKSSKKSIKIKMPENIYPAYIGVLCNTNEEFIIYTVLLELIRKKTLIIVKSKYYTKGLKISLYRKYSLVLTDLAVDLEDFENEFIRKLREMDDIYLINLEELRALVGRGYFSDIIFTLQENYKEKLRKGRNENISLEEILKKKNLSYSKWLEYREEILTLSKDEIEDMKIDDIEKLQVVSTALGIREGEFPLFSMINPKGLLMSTYFESLEQKYDNGKTVLCYLEETFLREEI